MARLIFKLFLNSSNAPAVLAWLGGLIGAYLAFLVIRFAVRCWRAWPLVVAERERQARLASFRARFGCDPRGLSLEQLASFRLRGSL